VLRFWLLILVAAAAPSQVLYEVSGSIRPEGQASVTLFGVTQPFTTSTFTDQGGRFTFKKLAAASYTLAVFQPGRGEARQTIEVGPSLADARHRIQLTVTLRDADFDPTVERRRHAVSVPELAIPERALRDYVEANRDLEKRDAEAAEKHLEHAVVLAPRFADAWNTLARQGVQLHLIPTAGCGPRSLGFSESSLDDPAVLENYIKKAATVVFSEGAIRDCRRHGMAMASCNQMADNGVDYFHCGHSMIVDATGELVALIPGSFIFEHLRERVAMGAIHPRQPREAVTVGNATETVRP